MRKLLLASLSLLSSFSLFAGQSVALGWNANPEPDLEGYKIYWGTASRSYDGMFVVLAPLTQGTVTDLEPGTTYYFALTAFIGDFESDFSDEVSYTVPRGLPPVPNETALVLSGRGLYWTPSTTFIDYLESTTDFITWREYPRNRLVAIRPGVYWLPFDAFPATDRRRFFRIRRDNP